MVSASILFFGLWKHVPLSFIKYTLFSVRFDRHKPRFANILITVKWQFKAVNFSFSRISASAKFRQNLIPDFRFRPKLKNAVSVVH